MRRGRLRASRRYARAPFYSDGWCGRNRTPCSYPFLRSRRSRSDRSARRLTRSTRLAPGLRELHRSKNPSHSSRYGCGEIFRLGAEPDPGVRSKTLIGQRRTACKFKSRTLLRDQLQVCPSPVAHGFTLSSYVRRSTARHRTPHGLLKMQQGWHIGRSGPLLQAGGAFHTGADGDSRRAWTYALERAPGLEYKKNV